MEMNKALKKRIDDMENEKYRSKSTKGRHSLRNGDKVPKSKKFYGLSKIRGKSFVIISQNKKEKIIKRMDNVIKKRKFVLEIVKTINHKYLPELEKKIKERKEKEKKKEKEKENGRTILRQKNRSMGKKIALTNINTINNTSSHSNTNNNKTQTSSSQKKISKNKEKKDIINDEKMKKENSKLVKQIEEYKNNHEKMKKDTSHWVKLEELL